MKLAILGGTFNPVHWGHIHLADEVRVALGFDRIVFVPDNVPAHKSVESRITPAQRIEMLARALAPIPHFVLDTCEIDRGGVSYAVDTALHMAEKHDLDDRLGFVLGDDLLAGFAEWKEAHRLSRISHLIVAHRECRERRTFAYPHTYVDNLVLPVSSSDIRRRIREGRSYKFLVPDGVWQIIDQQGLYREEAG